MKLVAVTSCPTGIAHSQMAAENLEVTAEERGHEIKVEIRGAMGTENELTAGEIDAAEGVIVAADTTVNRDRFEGKPLVKGTVKDAINDAVGLIEQAVQRAESGATEVSRGTDTAETAEETTASSASETETERLGGDPSKGLFARLRRLFS